MFSVINSPNFMIQETHSKKHLAFILSELTTDLLRKEAWHPPQKWNTRLLCIFQKTLAMATLGLKEMVKFLWEGREKGVKSRKKGRARIKK